MTNPDRVVDLRSDTVTKPGPAMRAAIASAEVDDDVLGHDPTTAELEKRVAALLGKEAALFVPSGTMANQICVRAHCAPGSEIVLDRDSHVLRFEAGAPQLAGVGLHPLDGDHGFLDPDLVKRAIGPRNPHVPPTALVWGENTHNAAGGTVWPIDRLDAVAAVAHDTGIPFHLDGARIWNAAVASGEAPARIAACADTVTVGLAKGLGAPVGSLLAGRTSFVEQAWVIRKQLGGGMRQSGVLAAAGLYALDHHVERLGEDHSNARILAERLVDVPGIRIDLAATQSNIVVIDVEGTGRNPAEIVRDAERRGVRIIEFGHTIVRAMTHLDVGRGDVLHAADVLAEVLAGSSARSAASSGGDR
jgi:threonine aldolase